MSINHLVLLGNLTRDPELRYTPGGSAVCQFGLGLNRRYKAASGELREETAFVEVVVWGKQAEVVAAHMAKGRAVFVEGRLQLDTWEAESGERRSRLKVVAERVTFLPRSGNGGAPAGGEDGAEPTWVAEEA
jgi:single-strand DNA-binding protein